MAKPTPKPTMKNGAVSDAAKPLKAPKPNARMSEVQAAKKLRKPGEITPAVRKWLNSLPPYERQIATIQIKGEKKAGKLSRGTM